MKRGLCILLLLCTLISLHADFVNSRTVGPGIQHHHEYRAVGPWHIHILEIDCTISWNQIKTVKAYNQLAASARTSIMTANSDSLNHRVIGAVNGDFYDRDGIPIGAQVIEGLLLKRPFSRSVFGITDTRFPFIDIVTYSGSIQTTDGSQYPIDGINERGTANSLILYNSYDNQFTDTLHKATQIKCSIISEQTVNNDTIIVVVWENQKAKTAKNDILLAGMGEAAAFMRNHIYPGDTLVVLNKLTPLKEDVSELIGGMPRLIRNGQASVEWIQENVSHAFTYNRHPRTAVGINADGTRVFFFTVDGRQHGYSVGMSLFELAGYMLSWGVEEGINLDGGGSTTMIVHGEVVNSPSDYTGERHVSNALMVVDTAPEGSLQRINIYPRSLYSGYNQTVQFRAASYDAKNTPLEINPKQLKWRIDPQIGVISETGLFTAGAIEGRGYVYVQMDNILDSSCVVIAEPQNITVSPKSLSLVVGRQYLFRAFARNQSGTPMTLTPDFFKWRVSDTIGSINAHGLFNATQPGAGFVIASYSAIADSAAVRIQILENQK